MIIILRNILNSGYFYVSVFNVFQFHRYISKCRFLSVYPACMLSFFLIKFIWGLICIVWNSLFLDTVLGIHTFWRHSFVSFDEYIQIRTVSVIMLEDSPRPQFPLPFTSSPRHWPLTCSLRLQFPSSDGHRARSTVWSLWSLGFFHLAGSILLSGHM